MNNYEFISKQKITVTHDGETQVNDPILLHEYMVFSDHKKRLKFILLKFINISHVIIQKFRFEVYEYNQDNHLIRKSTYGLEGLNIRKKTRFTFPNKIMVLNDCSTIEIKILSAESETLIWNGNAWESIEIFVEQTEPIIEASMEEIPIEIKSFSEDTIRSTEIMRLHKNEFSFNWLKPIVLIIIFLAVLVIIYYVSYSILMD